MEQAQLLTRAAFTDGTRVHRLARQAAATCAFLAGALLLAPRLAYAGVGVSVSPTYPTAAEVGDTNLAASLSLQNASTSPQNASSLTLDSIKHTPSCGMLVGGPCPGGQQDPGVFAVKGPITGRAGTACGGTTFTTSLADAGTGELNFLPSATVILQPPGNPPLDECIIDFFIDVLRVPTHDAFSSAGIQTAALARVSATVNLVAGESAGSALVTVMGAVQKHPAPALGLGATALVAFLLVAFGVSRVRSRQRLLYRQRVER